MRRLGLSLAAAVLALAVPDALSATPAAASVAPSVPLVGVLAPAQVIVAEGQRTPVTVTLVNGGTATARGVVLQFGSPLHPVDGALGLSLPAGCDAQGCPVGALAPGNVRKFSIELTFTGTALTSTFDVTVGVLGYPAPITVVRAGSARLQVAGIDDLALARAQSTAVHPVIRNIGSAPVGGIALVLTAEEGLILANPNCATGATDGAVVCRLDQSVPPGATVTTSIPLSVTPDAGGPHRYRVSLAAVGSAAQPTAQPLTAPTSFGVRVRSSTADSTAIGGDFDGGRGDTATIRVGVRNSGPTGVIPPSLGWLPTVRVTIPSGVRLTAVDDDCVPGADSGTIDFATAGTIAGSVYTCFVLNRLTTGTERLFTFTGKITESKHEIGEVTVDGGFQDPTATNDRAILTVGATTSPGAGTDWVTLTAAILLCIVIWRRKVRLTPAPPSSGRSATAR